MRKPFGLLEAAMLKAMAGAMFHGVAMVISPAQVVANIQTQFSFIHGPKSREIALSLVVLCLIMGGPFFLLMPPAWRQRLLDRRLVRSNNNLLQDLARVRGVIHAGYYGHWQDGGEAGNADNPVLAQLGFELPAARVRGPGEIPLRFFERDEIRDEDFVQAEDVPEEADVIVIGSGAGGAVAAAELTRAGHRVLVIEAGGHWPSASLSIEERRMASSLYVDGALQTSRDNDIIIFQGRCVGGSTVINNGICLRVDEGERTHPDANDVLGTWARLGAPVDQSRFVAGYRSAEERLQIKPVDRRTGRSNGTHMLGAWAAYAAASGNPADAAAPALWFNKNFGPARGPGECVHCGYCNTGCAYGRRTGVAQAHLIDVTRAGGRILANTEVLRLRWRHRTEKPRVAEGVEVRLADGRKRFIRAKTGIVVAAGTLASSRILSDSGVRGAGTGISLNIACPVVGRMPQGSAVRSWDEDQMTTYVDRGDFLIESHFQPPMSMAALMPGWFGEHARRMQLYGEIVSAGVLFPVDRIGRLAGGKLEMKLRADHELVLLRRGLATLARVHFAGGATEVWPGLARGQTLYLGDDIDRFFADNLREPDDVSLSSSHPQGGNARGSDPATSVVDLDCRLHGAANVVVADASVFPSCIRVNAMLTTMAMAHYACAGNPFADNGSGGGLSSIKDEFATLAPAVEEPSGPDRFGRDLFGALV